jgi:hypothetical protein
MKENSLIQALIWNKFEFGAKKVAEAFFQIISEVFDANLKVKMPLSKIFMNICELQWFDFRFCCYKTDIGSNICLKMTHQ